MVSMMFDIIQRSSVATHNFRTTTIEGTSVYTVCPTRNQTRHFFNNSNTNEDSFIHSVFCLTTGPKPPPK